MVTSAERVKNAMTFINTLGLCLRAFSDGDAESLDSILDECNYIVEDLAVVLDKLRKEEAHG